VLLELDHILGRDESIETRVLVMGLIGFPLTVLSGSLSYRFVERPFLERKQRTTQHASSEPAAPALEPAR
jgi:peptidoglycan/LPS O-acetylase OafA/YrhL